MILVFLYMILDNLTGDVDDNFSDCQSNIRKDIRTLQWATTLIELDLLEVFLVFST